MFKITSETFRNQKNDFKKEFKRLRGESKMRNFTDYLNENTLLSEAIKVSYDKTEKITELTNIPSRAIEKKIVKVLQDAEMDFDVEDMNTIVVYDEPKAKVMRVLQLAR